MGDKGKNRVPKTEAIRISLEPEIHQEFTDLAEMVEKSNATAYARKLILLDLEKRRAELDRARLKK